MRIEGPVGGRPWSAPVADIATRGYVMEEFFLEGEAGSYEAEGELTRDGIWAVRRGDSAPFRTRFLVVRPSDASRFNGTVLLHWLNVTAGYELGTADNDEILSGYAWVGVSAQKVGIDGRPADAPAYSGRQLPGKPLKQWDAERYGSLVHPGDRFSFDIFTQAVRAVAPSTLGGFAPQRLVATGASQSGARLTTYINGVHPLERAFDGFLPSITSGWATPLGDSGMISRTSTRIRADLDVPVLILNSECEAEGMFPARRPDDDRFRFFEVAGAPHAIAMVPLERSDGRVDNTLSYQPVLSAAYRHLHHWVAAGTPPPSLPPIELSAEGEQPEIRRDPSGNALGGIRLPEMAAPVAEYHGRDADAPGLTSLYGWARPFTRDELRSLYASREAYRDAWTGAVDALAASGGMRPEDVADAKARGDAIADGLEL